MKESATRARLVPRWLRKAAFDVLIGLAWAALVVAILVFAGGGSDFIYVDF